MKLTHNTTGVLFTYISDFTPQFTGIKYVRLLNNKSGKIECFVASTYLQHFTIN